MMRIAQHGVSGDIKQKQQVKKCGGGTDGLTFTLLSSSSIEFGLHNTMMFILPSHQIRFDSFMVCFAAMHRCHNADR